MTHKISEQPLKQAVTNSTSIRQVLLALGISALGGNYKLIQKKCKEYNIDTSHFLGMAQKGRPRKVRTDTAVYLNNDQPIQSHRLKLRLIREGIMTHQCSCCGGTEWLGKPTPIELDHIDGDSDNNELSNLRLLCPNCHALTPTYRGKNKKK